MVWDFAFSQFPQTRRSCKNAWLSSSHEVLPTCGVNGCVDRPPPGLLRLAAPRGWHPVVKWISVCISKWPVYSYLHYFHIHGRACPDYLIILNCMYLCQSLQVFRGMEHRMNKFFPLAFVPILLVPFHEESPIWLLLASSEAPSCTCIWPCFRV